MVFEKEVGDIEKKKNRRQVRPRKRGRKNMEMELKEERLFKVLVGGMGRIRREYNLVDEEVDEADYIGDDGWPQTAIEGS